MLESSTDFETIYWKTVLYNNTAPLPAEEEIDLYYIYFIKSLNSLVYKIDNNANRPVKTNIILGEDQDLLELLIFEYIKRYIARSEGDIYFSLLALVYNTSNLY